MKVGVVIPVYNRAQLVKLTLQSVAAQSLQPDNVVLIDDGSTDKTSEILELWAEKNQHKFTVDVMRTDHRGAYSARNFGWTKVRHCDAVAFLDSDDQWPAEFLSAAVEAMTEQRIAVAFFADSMQVYGEDDIKPGLQAANMIEAPAPYIFAYGAGFVPCAVIRTSAISGNNPFDTDLPTGADVPFFLELAKTGPFAKIDCAPVTIARNIVPKEGEAGHLYLAYSDRHLRWANIFEREFNRLPDATKQRHGATLHTHLHRRWRHALEETEKRGDQASARWCRLHILEHRRKVGPVQT